MNHSGNIQILSQADLIGAVLIIILCWKSLQIGSANKALSTHEYLAKLDIAI